MYIQTSDNANAIPPFLQLLTKIYVFIILCIYPLVFFDFYFDILSFKYYFYVAITLLYFAFLFFYCIFNRVKPNKFKIKDFFLLELFVVFFIVISIISTLQSDYIYESFWGNEGRYTGCFLLILYMISIVLVSRYFVLKKWMLNAFLFTGMLVCYFGITDYFQLDILHFKVSMDPGQKNMFVSTIGNINTYTSYVAMVMAVACVLFSKAKNMKNIIVYYICMASSFFAIVMGLSDNSYLAIGTLFALLPIYLFGTKTGIRRYMVIITSFALVIYIVDLINKIIPDRVIKMEGILQYLSGYNRLEIIVVGLFFVCLFLYLLKHFGKDENEILGRRWQVAWLIIITIITALLFYVLYDINVSGNVRDYGKLGQYVVFNDDWGTHRGYNWRIGLENYSKLPFIHKLFGYGPDTYGILTHYNNYNEMMNKYKEAYDNIHNEYLQYFVTMGPISLISYLGILVSSGILMIRKGKNNPIVIAAFFAVLCYAVQAFVNISVPIVTPIMFTLLAIGVAGARNGIIEAYKEKTY